VASKAATAADKRALATFQERFAKSFGEGRLRRASELEPYQVISTGSLDLDYKMGVGGYVEGRLTEIWGPDALGKTTLALLGIVEAQKKHPDKETGFIDMEQTLDLGLAKGLGVDTDRLMVYSPESAEEVADAMKRMLSSGLFSMIVLDSIGAMIPEVEKEKDADEATMAVQAKIVTRMVKIAAVEAAKCGAVVILINQVRANLSYGADTTTGGGFALKHVTTHKLKLKRTGTQAYSITRGGEKIIVGHELAIEVERNKVAPPKRVATVSLYNQSSDQFGPRGIDRADEAATLGVKREVGEIEQGGAWYTIKRTGERCNGRPALVAALRAAPEVVEAIREAAVASLAAEVVHGDDAAIEIPEDDPDVSPAARSEALAGLQGSGLVGSAAPAKKAAKKAPAKKAAAKPPAFRSGTQAPS
jgi:recombination protein RecA